MVIKMNLSKITTDEGRFLDLLESKKIIQANELELLDIDPRVPSRLEKNGHIYSVARGIYIRPNEVSPWTHYWAVAARCDQAVFCLYSALVIHGVTTQHAHSVWCELPRKTRRPAMGNIPIEFITATAWKHTIGVKTVRLDNIPVKVTSLERTVVDCFRLRRVVGMEVALEALKAVINDNLVQIEDLEVMAKKMKVFSVMKPYIEALS
jgi:predicted transcriptional regulator of viral defense system